MIPVEMPKANENLVEATLDRWLVKEGDSVQKDQSLCEIITDKAKFEMPSPAAGVVLKILGGEHEVLPVGYVMCVLGEAGQSVPADFAARNEARVAAHRGATAAIQTPDAGSIAPAPGSGAGLRATPAARRVARELGVDLAAVAAKLNLSGPVGEKDVRRFLEMQ